MKIFERRPPSAVIVPGNVAAPVELNSQVCIPTVRSMAFNGVWIIDVPITDKGRLKVPSKPKTHVYVSPVVIFN